MLPRAVGVYPRVVDPPSGRSTANSRVVDGEMLEKVGFGGYDLGARAKQIRDDLLAIDKATPEDMLKVQIDDRALFLARWRDLLLGVLTPERVAQDPRRGEMRKLETSAPSGRFSGIVLRDPTLAEQVFESLTAPWRGADPRLMDRPLFTKAALTSSPSGRASARPKYATREDHPGRGGRRRRPLTGRERLADQTGAAGTRQIASFSGALLARSDMPKDPLPGDRTCCAQGWKTALRSARRSPGSQARAFFTCPSGRAAILSRTRRRPEAGQVSLGRSCPVRPSSDPRA